jgi:hypothetical protein
METPGAHQSIKIPRANSRMMLYPGLFELSLIYVSAAALIRR